MPKFCATGSLVQAGLGLANTAANLTTAGLVAYDIYSYEPPKDTDQSPALGNPGGSGPGGI